MSIFSVQTASPRALTWVEQFETACVLNIFPSVINLSDNGNHIVTIVTEKIGNGPFSMVVNSTKISQGISLADQISSRKNQLIVGETIFSTAKCKIWNPIPKWGEIRKINKIYLINLIEKQLSNVGMVEGFGEVFYKRKESTQTKFFTVMKTGSNKLLDGLKNNNSGEIISAASLLGGLGPGLTPSGDDFLVGVIFALWALFPRNRTLPISKMIFAGAAGNTTTLSRELLAAAVSGETVECWHTLINAVLAQNENKIFEAVSEIITSGETSGVDALCGFVQALKILEDG